VLPRRSACRICNGLHQPSGPIQLALRLRRRAVRCGLHGHCRRRLRKWRRPRFQRLRKDASHVFDQPAGDGVALR
jgi:hypothetical protein